MDDLLFERLLYVARDGLKMGGVSKSILLEFDSLDKEPLAFRVQDDLADVMAEIFDAPLDLQVRNPHAFVP